MSVSEDQGWVYRFHDSILIAMESERGDLESTLLPGMIKRNVSAAIDYHDRMGPVVATDVVSPFAQTRALNPDRSRRAVTLQSSDAVVLITDENTLREMADPQSSYTQLIVKSIKRRGDKHIIDGLVGTAQTAAVTSGTGVITLGTQVLPSGRKLGTGVAVTLTNIIGANVLLSKAGCPPGAQNRVMLYSPGQLQDVLAITQASSSDFTRHKVHDSGSIDGIDWEGFHWKEICDLMDIDGTTNLYRMLPISGTARSMIAYYKGALGLSIGRPVGAPTIDPRPDLQSRPTQVRQAMMQGGVRVFEGGVVELSVLEN